MSKAHIPPAVAIIGHTTLIYWKERRIGQIKGLKSNMWLILLYTLELVINEVVPNFKILGQVVNKKSLTKISIFIIYNRVGETGVPRENHLAHPQAELVLSHMWPVRGSNLHQTQR